MSLGCARCGDCCDPVHLDAHARGVVERRAAADDLHPDDLAEVTFLAEHWTEIRRDPEGGAAYRCAAFDTDTRTCTAHDARPPVCSRFPMYDAPGLVDPAITPLQCSYLLDVDPAARPAGARPLIPLEVLA